MSDVWQLLLASPFIAWLGCEVLDRIREDRALAGPPLAGPPLAGPPLAGPP